MSLKNILVSVLIFLGILSSSVVTVVTYADDITYYKIVDYTEISLFLEKSTFSDDLVKQVADYCNTHGMYYSVSTYTYLAEPPRRTSNCITIFYGMRGSIPTFLAYRFKFKPDNSFYLSQGLDYEFTDDSLVVENGNFSKLSDIVGSFSFSEQQLKDKYNSGTVINNTYNSYTTDSSDNDNILYNLKTNNSLLVIIGTFILFGLVIFVFYKIFSYFM